MSSCPVLPPSELPRANGRSRPYTWSCASAVVSSSPPWQRLGVIRPGIVKNQEAKGWNTKQDVEMVGCTYFFMLFYSLCMFVLLTYILLCSPPNVFHLLVNRCPSHNYLGVRRFVAIGFAPCLKGSDTSKMHLLRFGFSRTSVYHVAPVTGVWTVLWCLVDDHLGIHSTWR